MRNSNRLARVERAAGVGVRIDVTKMTDAELETILATRTTAERKRFAQMTDAELETIAGGRQDAQQ